MTVGSVRDRCGEDRARAVRGHDRGGVVAFKGVRFAAPPEGPLRFRPPAPPPGWDGVRDCLTFGPSATQLAPRPGVPPVWRPDAGLTAFGPVVDGELVAGPPWSAGRKDLDLICDFTHDEYQGLGGPPAPGADLFTVMLSDALMRMPTTWGAEAHVRRGGRTWMYDFAWQSPDFTATGDPGWPAFDLEHRRTRIWDTTPSDAEDPIAGSRRIWERAGPN